jgi:hypothetical protein
MPEVDIGALRVVATHLDAAGLNYAFTGGSVVNLLLDAPDLSPARPTKDVDVIVELVSGRRYSDVEEVLRKGGFNHDDSEGAPICRWRLGLLVVDIMPTDGGLIGLNTKWFREALETAKIVEYAHERLRVVSPIGLLVTKYLTFTERGEGDYYASHDLEDFLTVVDGRSHIVEEIGQARSDLRAYLVLACRALSAEGEFIEALPGYLPPDSASQARLPILLRKLEGICSLLV